MGGRRARVGSVSMALVAAGVLLVGCTDDGPTRALSAEAEAGESVARSKGCLSCHSDDGSSGVGPTFEGLWGSTVQLEGGGSVVVDRAHLTESVRDPSAKKRKGQSGQMPEFDSGRLSDADLDAIEDYLTALAQPTS